MSHKLTMDQIQQARIRMEGEHAIKRRILMKIEPVMDIEDEFRRLREDKQRMDWIESQSDGTSWMARQSNIGRGFRLHNTGNPLPGIMTAREAIDLARKRSK